MVSQSIVQPNAKSPVIIERSVEIKLLAEVDDFLEWEFISLEDSISIKLGENKVISYLGKNLSNTLR